MKNVFLLLLVFFCTTVNVLVQAQSVCDTYYDKATKFQQTVTIKSQNMAIAQFKKAMECYDSEAMKDRCQNQIDACKNTVKILSLGDSKPNEPVNELTPSATQTITSSPAPDPVQLSADIMNVKFRSKGGYKPVMVSCNYDWRVTEVPDWVRFSINKERGELIIQSDTFRYFDKYRSGKVVIDCRGIELEILVEQQSILWFF